MATFQWNFIYKTGDKLGSVHGIDHSWESPDLKKPETSIFAYLHLTNNMQYITYY